MKVKKTVTCVLLNLVCCVGYAVSMCAVSACPRCGHSAGSYSSPWTKDYHTTKCGLCSTSYQQNHTWAVSDSGLLVYCSKCGWY